MPQLYIIAGCNGAGKTTASFTVLPEMLQCREFVNADEIARGLSPFQPETVALEAGRIMLQRIDTLLAAGGDFALETTLATRSYAQTIARAQAMGYHVTLIYFWLNSPALAVARVHNRVMEGGHYIPPEVVQRRYERGLHNLFRLFMPRCDYWLLIDNSRSPYEIIAEGTRSNSLTVHSPTTWHLLHASYSSPTNE